MTDRPISNERLCAALSGLLTRYVDLVNCGDCGNWDPEKEREVIEARAALSGDEPVHETKARRRYSVTGRFIPLSENGVPQNGLTIIHETTHDVYMCDDGSPEETGEHLSGTKLERRYLGAGGNQLPSQPANVADHYGGDSSPPAPDKCSEKASVKPWTRGGNPEGTHRVGYVHVPYSKVVEVFGEPKYLGDNQDHRVIFEWVMTFSDGTVATIYDYKQSKLYGDDPDAPTPDEMKTLPSFEWHIGGKSQRAVELVHSALNGKGKPA